MNNFRRFMYGRYGIDQLSRALVIISLVISLIATFLRFTPLVILGYLPFLYAIYRIFSKNIPRRTQENQAYYRFTYALKARFNHIKLALVGTKTHKYYTCSRCKQTIRVPRGKGKICITCPKCRNEFVKRT